MSFGSLVMRLRTFRNWTSRQGRISDALDQLAANPYDKYFDVRPLTGRDGEFRCGSVSTELFILWMMAFYWSSLLPLVRAGMFIRGSQGKKSLRWLRRHCNNTVTTGLKRYVVMSGKAQDFIGFRGVSWSLK